MSHSGTYKYIFYDERVNITLYGKGVIKLKILRRGAYLSGCVSVIITYILTRKRKEERGVWEQTHREAYTEGMVM